MATWIFSQKQNGTMARVDKMAAELINDKMPEIYVLNHNYGTYEIEKGARINTSYTLYDRDTVMKLAIEDPDLLPTLKPNRALDERWNRNSSNSGILNGILTGAPVQQIARDVALGTSHADMVAAIRNARTATTSAENAGRINSYERAEEMGIKMKQMWMAALDGRTRHEHRLLDGQTVDVGEPFHVNGYTIRYPGDPQAAPEMVYNCRCTVVAKVEGANLDASDLTQRNNKLDGMSYNEWKNQLQKPQIGSIINRKGNTKLQRVPNAISTELKANHVRYNMPKLLKDIPTENEIIQAISGGDMTKGSCASVGLAYCAQKSGYDVLDFRDGKSRDFFSTYSNIRKISALPGLDSKYQYGSNYRTIGKQLLQQAEVGKQYYFTCGRHATIVQKLSDGRLQYLELQSNFRNGWEDFDADVKKTLSWRFGCPIKKYLSAECLMIDVDSFKNCKEFADFVGYINTAETKQRKGTSGSIK